MDDIEYATAVDMTPLSSDHHIRTAFLSAERGGKGVSSTHMTLSLTRTGQININPPAHVLVGEQINGILIYQSIRFFHLVVTRMNCRKHKRGTGRSQVPICLLLPQG